MNPENETKQEEEILPIRDMIVDESSELIANLNNFQEGISEEAITVYGPAIVTNHIGQKTESFRLINPNVKVRSVIHLENIKRRKQKMRDKKVLHRKMAKVSKRKNRK